MKPVPYNTGKVLIGRYYEPPRRNTHTPEADYWQSVLLGEARVEFRRRCAWAGYCVALFVIAMLAMVLA